MSLSVPPRVRLVCRVMKVVCVVAAPTLPIFAALAVIYPFELTGSTYFLSAAPSPILAVISGIILATPMLVVAFGLLRLSASFRDYARGDVFTRVNAARLRGFGTALLLAALLKPVATTIAVLVLTMGNPPGQRILQIGVGTDELTLAALGAGIAVVGWVMSEAARLVADAEQIV